MKDLLRFAWLFGASMFAVMAVNSSGAAETLKSPNQRIEVTFELTQKGQPRYLAKFDGQPVLNWSQLGLIRDDADFTTALKLVKSDAPELVRDDYTILTAKRRENHYVGNRRTFHLETSTGRKMDVIFQMSDDGFAFRYFFPEKSETAHTIKEERSSFYFLPKTKAWLQPIAAAKTGWSRTNPSYEEHYQKEIDVGTPSPTGAGWVFPALFRSGETWLLLSEGSLPRSYCASRLGAESPDGEYFVRFPDEREVFTGQGALPESTLPWLTPWRFVVVGSLQTIAESMLGVDLAEKPSVELAGTPRPGKAAWSWPLLGDGQTTYEVQKRFVDYAAEMKWRYCLIDALWDVQIGYEKTKELVEYAKTKGVEILVWYNSAGEWNDAPQTPRNLLLTHESRLKEFQRLKDMGVAGLKIDFFGGDGRSMIAYYHDILQDSARFGFMINFHGATLPRGWQRTYPHLMTMEAIKGLEFITFDQKNADAEPSHAAMLPFARNVFDPMDFTPMVLDEINDRIQRRTTSAFELALSVVFTSGIQHYAEIPQGMAKAPDYVREFLKAVPSVWEDVRFIDGFPGKYVVMARRGEGRWYVAGINGEVESKALTLDLNRIAKAGAQGLLIADGEDGNLSFRKETVRLGADGKMTITLPACGGFVLVVK
ncbi:MAG: glycoside hydrolase family 97 catalytic domain-containing protein [Nibricoccus sp.]